MPRGPRRPSGTAPWRPWRERVSRLSLCLIARNEAAFIGRCLASVRDVADELIVVDTGSTDDTAERARAAGALTSTFEWNDDFSAARNAALDRASGEWVLILDADEELAPESRPLVRPLLERSAGTVAYQVIVRNLQPANELLRYQDTHIVRLFRRLPGVRFRDAIHESVDMALSELKANVDVAPVMILHDGYAREVVQGQASRADRNLALLQQAVTRDPADAYLQYQLGVSHRHSGRVQDAQRHLQAALAIEGRPLAPHLRAAATLKLAQMALGQKRYGSAATYAQRALGYDASAVVARIVLGLSLMYQGRASEALAHLERALADGEGELAAADDLRALIDACRRGSEG